MLNIASVPGICLIVAHYSTIIFIRRFPILYWKKDFLKINSLSIRDKYCSFLSGTFNAFALYPTVQSDRIMVWRE